MKNADATDPLKEQESIEPEALKESPEQPATPTEPGSVEEPAPAPEVLIDDHEEKKVNDSYDDDVDHEDHNEDQPNDLGMEAAADAVEKSKAEKVVEAAVERVNYALLSKEDLVKMMRERLDNPAKGNIRKEVDEIRQVFTEKQIAALEEKKAHFLEEGGTLEDFRPAEDRAESEMKELLNKYRILKAEYTRQLEKTKHENLHKKQEVLDELRGLMGGGGILRDYLQKI